MRKTIDRVKTEGGSFSKRSGSKRSGTSANPKGAETKSKTHTFRNASLEACFLHFCQLSTDVPAVQPSKLEWEQVRDQAANFIYSDEFVEPTAETSVLGEHLLEAGRPSDVRQSTKKVNLPPHLAGLCEEQLLTSEQERVLFRRMNYLRFRADQILSAVEATSIGQWDLERVRGLLRAADWYRDIIVKANVRLVISIVKKFANPQCSFDDLLSDGIMALIRSVDKFDYQLGFRFSTYATQVVRRNSYRFVMERQDERLKITNSINEPGLDVVADEGGSSMSELRWNTLREHLRVYLDLLDKREKLIIRARFSLGGHRKVKTLQRLADTLGISKERVRQLEKRAIEKLQNLVAQNPPEIAEA